MSEVPVVRRSTGVCHNLRQENCSAQKQIICPIYGGKTRFVPYWMGLGTGILIQIQAGTLNPGMNRAPQLQIGGKSVFFTCFQRLRKRVIADRKQQSRDSTAHQRYATHQHRCVALLLSAFYSAAAAECFASVALAMKSQMRGTISDLNREPLNTP